MNLTYFGVDCTNIKSMCLVGNSFIMRIAILCCVSKCYKEHSIFLKDKIRVQDANGNEMAVVALIHSCLDYASLACAF